MPRALAIILVLLSFGLPAAAQLHNFGWVNVQGGKTVCLTYAVTSDKNGSTYYTGTATGVVNLGGVTLTPHGQSDGYVGKLNNAGVLQWAAQIDATHSAQPSALALDNAGNLYVTGTLVDSNFYGITPSMTSRIFLAKFDAKGNLLWRLTSQNAANAVVTVAGLAVSPSGRSVYLSATSTSASIFQGFDSVIRSVKAGMYTMRLDHDGNIRWLKTDTATGRALCIDSSENLYLAGSYALQNSIGGTKLVATKTNVASGFAASYDSAGKIRWVKAVDSLAATTMCYNSGYLFASNSYTSAPSYSNVLAMRMFANGTSIRYLRNKNTGVGASSLVADGLGYIYLTGQLPLNVIVDTVSSTGGTCYIMRMDTAMRPRWVMSWIGGTKIANNYPCVAVDTSRGLVISGTLAGQSSFGGKQVAAGAGTNGFVALIALQDLSFALPAHAMLCASDTMSVYVHTQGPFYAANKFVVQLSDSLGRFTSYTRIGEIQANSDCQVLCKIPATLNTGSKYRIRVAATSPVLTTHDNGTDLGLSTPPVALVYPSGSVDLCEDDSVTLTAYGGFAYWWSNGDTSHAITVAKSGKYNVWVFGLSGCIARPDPVTVTVHLMPPTPGISQAGNTLYSSASANNQWNRNGVPISAATEPAYTPTRSGTYTVTVSNLYKCSVTSDGVDVQIDEALVRVPSSRDARISANGVVTGEPIHGQMRVQIRNALGAMATERAVNADGNLDLSSTFVTLPNGVYYVRIETESHVFTLRFVNLH